MSTIIALRTRMRDLNQELMRQLAWKNRERPASERMHRLQIELPFVVQAEAEATANDASDSEESDQEDTEKEEPKRRKRKKPDQSNRDAHGRQRFPEHIVISTFNEAENLESLVSRDARVHVLHRGFALKTTSSSRVL